jgi:hypothetical protein
MRASPLFWPIGGLFKWLGFRGLLDWLAGGRPRRTTEEMPKPSPDQPSLVQPLSGPTNILLGFVMVYIFAMNIGSWKEPRNGEWTYHPWQGPSVHKGNSDWWEAVLDVRNTIRARLPDQSQALGYSLGLDQDWNLFGPVPTWIHGYLIVAGQLQDGTIVDLQDYAWHQRETPLDVNHPITPEVVGEVYPTTVWRKYCVMMIEATAPNQHYRQHYVAYFAELWNSHHPDRPLRVAAMYWRRVITQPNHQPAKTDTIRMCRLNCLALNFRDPKAANLTEVSLDDVGSREVSDAVVQMMAGLGMIGSPMAPLTQFGALRRVVGLEPLP